MVFFLFFLVLLGFFDLSFAAFQITQNIDEFCQIWLHHHTWYSIIRNVLLITFFCCCCWWLYIFADQENWILIQTGQSLYYSWHYVEENISNPKLNNLIIFEVIFSGEKILQNSNQCQCLFHTLFCDVPIFNNFWWWFVR